ncbi:small multi-drug export protein [Clostridium sp.]|uniref:COG2426 family protein n=1 Tax=Clostridium sp. TaxID=1506 RepID=UPI001A3E0DC8|nr:small multi-drug export protein [Clostridium sp.]MBK5235599.1 small multi-drug export protein [Clostridium sp.]
MKLLEIFFWSMVPIIEQKGAIIRGIITYNLNPQTVFFVSLIGSLIPVPFILIFFNRIYKWMQNYKTLNGINNYINKKLHKNCSKFLKYKEIALVLFIAIPLPTTGLWTGSAIAAFLKFNFKKSIFCAIIGGVISAFLITVSSVVFPTFLGM